MPAPTTISRAGNGMLFAYWPDEATTGNPIRWAGLVADLRRAGAGVRAQAMDRSGKLLDDFHVVAGAGMVHVLNAPSPAATASISIGRKIADMVEGKEDAVNRPAPPS